MPPLPRWAPGRTEHVIRTRMLLTDAADWEAVGHTHGEVFGTGRPAATMVVVAGLLDLCWRSRLKAEVLVDAAG